MHRVDLDVPQTAELLAWDTKRFLASIGDRLEFHCGLMVKKDGSSFINLGSSILKKLKLKEGDNITLSFQPDHSDYQFEMPEEFAAVLQSDPEASLCFHELSPGNQRGILYLINKLKSEDKRIALSLRIATKIKSGITKPSLLIKK